jgi:carbon-monoxide dehydrogenase medium subunit
MKAEAVGYIRATDTMHAISLLAESRGGARLLAGGQSLVASMNLRLTGEMSLISTEFRNFPEFWWATGCFGSAL